MNISLLMSMTTKLAYCKHEKGLLGTTNEAMIM